MTSPAQHRQTVGNSSKFARGAERVQILEKDDTFALGRIWVAFVRQASQDVANSSKPLTNPQISLYGSYCGILIPNTESGEGVVSTGEVVQVLDYYPFGSERIDTGTDVSQRQFIGEFFDEETEMSYLNARYLQNDRGQFISQDPTHLAIGDATRVESVTGLAQQAVLSEPQLLNSYSYAKNNPIRYKDPEGKFVPQAVALGALYGGGAGIAFQAYSDYQSGSFNGVGTYAGAATKGAITGAAAAINPLFGAGAAGGSSLLGAYFQDGNISAEDAVNAATEGAVTGVTAGFVKGLPQVRGVQATKVLGGRYFTGAHGTRYAQEAAFGVGVDVYRSNISGITGGLITNGQTQGGSSNGSIVKQLQSIVKSLQGIVSSLKNKKK